MTAPLRHVELTVAGNEASDLLPVLSPSLLEAHGARRGVWTAATTTTEPHPALLDRGPADTVPGYDEGCALVMDDAYGLRR